MTVNTIVPVAEQEQGILAGKGRDPEIVIKAELPLGAEIQIRINIEPEIEIGEVANTTEGVTIEGMIQVGGLRKGA
eukprot:CAMPEP_0204829198 /NCGR_PEP_ID=MMETSP1346-20131115/7267_1 /ASSEMBLY_ACC=CAM_ASM_000771 /TAXON_ID=215587 /ORGANISM="Aplanochytrium stocchinoi, Strain GSBS06" /LENGTH=75 /DNA_ID=CAMNT_0051958785 /DNA_START=92 /DNA_END=316 /DNA_ORIENTATION=+